MIQQVNMLQPSLVEVRYDLLRKSPELVSKELNDTILQVAACRPGMIPDSERSTILKAAIDLGAVYVDVELDAAPGFVEDIIRYAKSRRTNVIVSYHNYDDTPPPDEMKDILHQCYSVGGDVAKIACQANSSRDSARLLSLYAEEGRKIVIGMGDRGRITRLAAMQLGAEFTFAAVSEAEATAPGQLSYGEMNSFEKTLNSR
ncbi:MAG: type I 3-dehydroquinate dehydratase [Bacteroidales bacterium]|nr:type I 3-dehydroquinate dehydratase [Bacteroidales bacterium]MDT8430014.1 type I 3-dehydroquinate dehydratase [Bacteroidales bacterium]